MLTRLSAALLALAVLAVAPAPAHEGHSHGAEPPQGASPIGPRAEAASPAFELVAVPRGGDLLIHLDRFATNEPVTGARIEVETPDGPATAEARAEGLYRLPAPWLGRGGHHDLVATVTAEGLSDVLTLDLDLPAPVPAPRAEPATSVMPAFVGEIRFHLGHQAPIGAALGGFLLGLAAIMLLRARMAAPAMALIAVTLTLLIGGAALAHEGHDHEETQPPVQGAALLDPMPALERSRRMPDGSVFVPKSIQHLLLLRTGMTAEGSHRRTVELPGRVIPDPNASGVVQSSVGGRLAPPPGGFPDLGACVRKGDLLATVTPPVQAVDVSDMRQTQGNLDQQIDVVARRVTRYEKLAATGAVAQTALDDARAELNGLKDRRAALDTLRSAPEPLLAPVAGVISERAAVAGQMAQAGTMVFRIVEPDKLYVEALSFSALEPGAKASARLPDGRVLSLAYRGAGLADREQAVPVQFAVEGGAQGLRMGQFVTVLAPTGHTAEGLAVPRASVLRSEGGSIVYEHVSAERFAPRPVRVEPLDAERFLIAGGLSAGRRVVTQGAELLDQVR